MDAMKQGGLTEPDVFDITVQQHRAWRGGKHPQYGAVVELEAEVEPSVIQGRLDDAIDRFEILRTSFKVAPGRILPDQVVNNQGIGKVFIVQAGSLSDALAQVAHTQAQLEQPTVGIWKRSVFLVGSSLTGDAHSAALLLSFLTQDQDPGPDDPLQYADYAGWQAAELEDSGKAEPRDRLTTPKVLGEVPSETATSWSTYVVDLGVPTVALDQIVSAWFIILRRLSDSAEVSFDLIRSGREMDETNGAIGPFETQEPLTCHVPLDMPAMALVAQASAIVRGTGDAIIQLRDERQHLARAKRHNGTGLRFIAESAHPLTLVFDQAGTHPLTVTVHPATTGYHATFSYDPTFISADSVRALASQYGRAVQATFDPGPDLNVEDLDLIDDAEQDRIEKLLSSPWTSPSVDPPTVLEAFDRQVAQSPDMTCVIDGTRELTYAEVDALANALAQELSGHGVTADTPVGILMERSVQTVAALLGILKTGGAYLPLDLDAPPVRHLQTLQLANAAALVTTENVTWHCPVPVINFTDATTRPADTTARRSAKTAEASSLAYIIPTSGSTGVPKLVAVTHGSLAHLSRSLRQAVYDPINPGRSMRVALNGPLTFDTSIKQWIQVLHGHTLVVVPAELRFEPSNLMTFFADHDVDVVDCTPSQLQTWLDQGLQDLSKPPVLLVGGEPIPPAMWRQLADSQVLRCFNLYGPTECTVDTTVAEITEELNTPVIGRALPHLQVEILDARGRTQPAGAIGELTVTGCALARGYLADPDATKASFGIPPHRRYRTGDLVSLTPTGTLAFHGRSDRQVKIRGYRIDPGEVESALTDHPQVKAAAVVALDGGSGLRLVAYWVPGGDTLTPDILRKHLKSQLPDYLVPQQLMQIAHLPLTHSGKIDLANLPEPDAGLQTEYVEPHNDNERLVAEVFGKVLGLRQVGRNDGFSASGGDSIQCIQAVSSLRQRGLVVSPAQVFRLQTVAALAEIATPAEQAEPVVLTGPTIDAALTPIQLRFFARNLENPHHWNQSMLFELDSGVTPKHITQALSAVLRAHQQLNMRYDYDSIMDSWMAHLGETQQPDVVEIAPGQESQIHQRLNITHGPLLAAGYLNTKPARLLLVVHHLAIDGVSWRILREDLQTALECLVASRPVTLSPSTTPYTAWADTLANVGRSGQLEGEAPYWAQQAGTLRLPEPANVTASLTSEQVVTLNESVTAALLEVAAHKPRWTVGDILVAAVATALHQHAPAQTLAVDCEGHGRQQELMDGADLTRTVGWFTAVYPQALHLSQCSSLREAVDHVCDRRETVPYGGVGYGVLRYIDNHRLMPSDAQILVNYLGQSETRANTSTILKPISGETGADRDPAVDRGYAIELDAAIVAGQLKLFWGVAEHRVESTWAQRFIDSVISVLSDALVANKPTGGNRNRLTVPSSVHSGLLERHERWPRYSQHLYQWHLHLDEIIDLELWEAAWNQVLLRHESLRISVSAAYQLQVNSQAELKITDLDCRGLPTEEIDSRSSQYLQQIQEQGLNLKQSPPLDIALVRHDSGSRILATFSLIAVDVTSFGVVIDEVWQIYRGEVQQLPDPSSPDWFATWTANRDWHAARQFWNAAMHGLDQCTLVANRPAPADGRHREYRELVTWLDDHDTNALLAFGREHRLTPNSMLQGLWARAVARRLGRANVVVGSIVDAAASADGPKVRVGRFVNFLPVHLVVDSTIPLTEWLLQQQDRFVSSLQFSYVTAEQVQAWNEIDTTDRLFDSLVAWEVDPFGELVANSHWPPVTNFGLVQDPDLPLKLTGTLREQLRVSLAFLPDQVDEAHAQAMLDEVCAGLIDLARSTSSEDC